MVEWEQGSVSGCHKVRSDEAAAILWYQSPSRLHEETRTAKTLGNVVVHHMRTSSIVIKPFCPPIFQSTEILNGLLCIPSWKCCGKGIKQLALIGKSDQIAADKIVL
jgi:hypothetical protein